MKNTAIGLFSTWIHDLWKSLLLRSMQEDAAQTANNDKEVKKGGATA